MSSRIMFIIVLNLLVYQDQAIVSLRIIFDRVEALKTSNDSKVQPLYCHVSPTNNSFFQGAFRVVQDLISSKLKLTIEVFKCLVGEAPDTCEYLITLKPPNSCVFMNAENMAWSTITDAFTPKLRCPFKKGKYVTDKGTFDASKWTMFPLDKWHFKLTYKMYEDGLFLHGYLVQTHFLRVH